MHYSVRILPLVTAYLSLTSLAGTALAEAQTGTATNPALAPSSATATGQVESSPQTMLPTTETPLPAPAAPTAPVAPVAPDTSAVAAPSSPAISPPPPAPLRIRTRDGARDWIRHGFYMRFGSGFGGVNLSGDGPKGSASLSGLGSSSLLALGGNLVGGLVLAGTVQASTINTTFTGGPFVDENVTSNGKSLKASNKADASAVQFGLLVDWYPNLSDGWHVGLSAGVGATSVKNHADDSTMTGGSAAGTLFGGYDWAIGPEWSIGFALVASGSRTTAMKYGSDQPDPGYRLKSTFLGISGSFLYF
jgi:hypothetical protein